MKILSVKITAEIFDKKAPILRHVLIIYLIKCDTEILTYGAILKVQGITIICTSTTLYEIHYQIFYILLTVHHAMILGK